MALFFLPNLNENHKFIDLTEEESKHCIRVLRYKLGDSIEIINGKGLLVEASVVDANPKKCSVRIDTFFSFPKTKDIHVAVCPTKSMDRMEWLTEKAVELGATKITFIYSKNCERPQLKLDRLEKIAVSAIKQSKRYYLPEIMFCPDVKSFVSQFPGGYIAHCHPGKKMSAVCGLHKGPIMIGPEGDFTKDEVERALQNGYQALDLGEFRLRTETAALISVFYQCS